MQNKSIKIKLLVAGSLLALSISIGVAANDQVRTNLSGTLVGQEEETDRILEQKPKDSVALSETESAEGAALAEGKSKEDGLKSSTSTDNHTDLEPEGYIAYLAEQQRDAAPASRGGSIREEQKQNTESQFSNQGAAVLEDQITTSQPISESAQIPDASGAGSKNEKEEASSEDQELDLLARLITAEAQGEPYEAQVAVGAVVLNRVKSGVWPDSIEGVIYQNIGGYDQFTPVVNGWIDKPAKESCIMAAKAALRGEDPTKGAQFYYDDTTTNEWILEKAVSVKIGCMIFAF
ncbi:cell wall hydrolase [Anoxybacterium hadale]|uniref:Cell wall hydrolase n=1 Tax=Anoxybacterium hadale TaxID=3408580 RepID=A0ACD1ABC9_9FIRM|nr:cell wall hydrolase [Clostridiales bacterium]